MTRSIKLTWASSRYIIGRSDAIRLRVEASCADNMPSKLFAYKMQPLNPAGEQLGHYSHVCSPVDIEEYPEDEPQPGHSPEWFRLDFVDVLLRSTAEAANMLEAIREDIQRIIWTLNRMDMLFFGGEVQYGVPVCPESSSSSSSTSSESVLGSGDSAVSSMSSCAPSSSTSSSQASLPSVSSVSSVSSTSSSGSV